MGQIRKYKGEGDMERESEANGQHGALKMDECDVYSYFT